MKTTKTIILAECAILIALSTVLSFLKIYKLPWGGSITLFSMLPVCYASIRHGLKWGLGTSFVYAVIQLFWGIFADGLLGWGLTGGILIACILLDYVLAFGVLGFSGAFAKKSFAGIMLGTAMTIVARFICHVFSGVYVFASVGKLWNGFETTNTWLYSLVYNSCYMLPELILTLVGAAICFKALRLRKI